MRKFHLPCLLAAAALGGCANTAEMRTLAGRLGSYADAHRAGILDAKGRFDALNVDAERERAQLDEQSAEAERRADQRVRAARISQPPRVVLAEGRSAADIVASLEAATVTVAPVEAGNAPAKLEAATKIAAQMAVKPKRLEQLREVVGIYAEVQGELAALQAKAAEDAKTTKAKAADKAAK